MGGEDLFAQACLDANGVSRGEAFGTKLDGTCEADRPTEEKKNKKWKPACDSQSFPAYHPLMKPEDYWACYEATTKAFDVLFRSGHAGLWQHEEDVRPGAAPRSIREGDQHLRVR